LQNDATGENMDLLSTKSLTGVNVKFVSRMIVLAKSIVMLIKNRVRQVTNSGGTFAVNTETCPGTLLYTEVPRMEDTFTGYSGLDMLVYITPTLTEA
jgi:hypothetical protein